MTDITLEKQKIAKTFLEASNLGVQDILLLEGERPIFTIKGYTNKDSSLPIWTRDTFNTLMLIILNANEAHYTDSYTLDFLRYVAKTNHKTLSEEFEHVKQDVFGSHDFKVNFGQSTFRCHLFTSISKLPENKGGVQLVMNVRSHPNVIPSLSDLNLPDLSPIFSSKGGLLLVSGSANVGKTTTVVSVINEFNKMKDKHRIIITAEDPVEYIIPNIHAYIIQKQIGGVNGNAETFAQATDDALRENADIVYIGEIRTKDEILNALRLSDLGKLVIATIHATSVPDTIERIVNEFIGVNPDQIRTRLINNLLGIVHQTLFSNGGEQYPLVSMALVTSPKVRKSLLECKNRDELDNFMLTGDARISDQNHQNPYTHVLHPVDGFNLLVSKGILSEHDYDRFFAVDGDDEIK